MPDEPTTAFPTVADLDALAEGSRHEVGDRSTFELAGHLRPLARAAGEPEILARLIGEGCFRAAAEKYGVADAAVYDELDWPNLDEREREVFRYAAHRALAYLTGDQLAGIEPAPGTVVADVATVLDDAPVDLAQAVLLEDVTTTLGRTLAGVAVAVELAGRINQSTTHVTTTYLTSTDGIVALVANIIDVAARIDPDFAGKLVAQVTAAIESHN